jgi:hypothetical protein
MVWSQSRIFEGIESRGDENRDYSSKEVIICHRPSVVLSQYLYNHKSKPSVQKNSQSPATSEPP